jgi:hypothetical protein
LLHNENVLGAIRRELRRIVDVPVSNEEVHHVLLEEVVKRDALECPAAEEAANRVRLSLKRTLRSLERRSAQDQASPVPDAGAEAPEAGPPVPPAPPSE